MALMASSDGGITWGATKTIYTGPATYSDLARDSLGNIYCIFGRDGNNIDLDPANPAARVTVAKFNLEWVVGGGPQPTVVVDNGATGFTTTGTWSTATGDTGYYGANYLTSTAGSATATWTPTITVAGNFDAYIRWTAHSNRSDAAPIMIKYNGDSSTATATLNQQIEGGTWDHLGTFALTAGTGNSVKVTASDAGHTVADAVMFQKEN